MLGVESLAGYSTGHPVEGTTLLPCRNARLTGVARGGQHCKGGLLLPRDSSLGATATRGPPGWGQGVK